MAKEKDLVEQCSECYENFPLHIVVLRASMLLAWFAIGAVIMLNVGTWALMGYVIYGTLVLLGIVAFVCRNCYYHGVISSLPFLPSLKSSSAASPAMQMNKLYAARHWGGRRPPQIHSDDQPSQNLPCKFWDTKFFKFCCFRRLFFIFLIYK